MVVVDGAGIPLGSYDQLRVTGTVSLTGELHLTLISGIADQIGDTYYILLNDGSDAITGLFSNVTALTATTGTIILGDGHEFFVNYAANAPLGDGGGNDISLTLQAVPEPSAWLALLASLGTMLCFQRFRHRSR
jgi:hypothetical protein